MNVNTNPWNRYLNLVNWKHPTPNALTSVNRTNVASSAGSDTVTLSREANFSQIAKRVDSGEPLTGVSYEEYKDYYYDTNHNFLSEREMRQTYQQAVRGTNDIVAKQDWYDEDVILTPEIQSDSEFQNAVSKQAERWANGETLTDAEKKVLQSDFNQYLSASSQRNYGLESEHISNLLSENGLALNDDEKIQISLYAGQFDVSGNIAGDKQAAIENVLNSLTKREKDSIGALYTNEVSTSYTKNVSKGERFLSSSIGETEYLLNQYSGGQVKLQDLSIDGSGQVQGLPEELQKYFEGVTSDLQAPTGTDDFSKNQSVTTKRAQKLAVETAVKALQEQGYDNLPRYSYLFEFSEGTLSAVDNYK